MSVFGKSPKSPFTVGLEAMHAAAMAQAAKQEAAMAARRGFADPSVVDLVEVNGVWMTPEDARRVKEAA
jgi:stage V sporulation protein SpoVS